MFTIGLFHAETKEVLHELLNEEGLRKSTEDLVTKHTEKTFCFLYMNYQKIVSRTNPNDAVIAASVEGSWRNVNHTICELRIDSTSNKVAFLGNDLNLGEATLPAPPVFLFYSNDGRGSAEILLGNEAVDEDKLKRRRDEDD